MNKLKISIIFGVLIVLAFGCADPDLAPIVTFDSSGKGAYPRLLEETSRDIDLYNLGAFQYIYGVEFVDPEKGGGVSEYGLEMTYQGSNGTTAGPVDFMTWSSSEFTVSANGYQSVPNISISAADLASAAGIKIEDIGAGDKFNFSGRVVTKDGQIFKAENSSATVQGAAFQGHFNFTLLTFCPSSLQGTYDVNVTASWCGNLPVPKVQVKIQSTSTNEFTYAVDDFSFGAYDNCYGVTSARPLGNLRIVDVCNGISITGASQWGEVYTWSNMAVNGDVWSFDWVNDYGEGGSAEVIRPGGWPPLVLD